jgi:polygalacturonase
MNRNDLKIYFVLVLLIITAGQSRAGDLPFVTPDIKEPKFPDNTFRITDFGAVGDGHTKNTEAFAKAINACADAGGGKVIIPAGLWLTGPIQLKSNVNLHTETGAMILFSGEFEDYPILRRTAGGKPEVRCMPPIYGENLNNIAITGAGVFDGAGDSWRPVKKIKMTDSQWKKLLASGGVVDSQGKIWYPSKEAMEGAKTVAELDSRNAELKEYAAAKQYLRPVLVGLVECKNVLIDGPTFQNSGDWNIHPLLCEDIIVRNVNVRNPWYSQNGDGLDPESCKNMIIQNCRFDVGDDAICMKSGKDEYGRRRGRPTENVAISDCIVYHGHGGFVVGSEMSGGVKNIYVRNCVFIGTDTGIRFKSTRGRGGVVENIYIQDIFMKDIPGEAVIADLYYSGKINTADTNVPEAAEETPSFRNIYFKNIVCSGADRAMTIQGLPEMPTQKFYFENITISSKAGITCLEAKGISFKNVRIMSGKTPVFALHNSRDFVMENIAFPQTADVFMKLYGPRTQSIDLKNIGMADITDKIQMEKDVKPDAVILPDGTKN